MTKEIVERDVTEMRQVVGLDFGINFLVTAYDSQGLAARLKSARPRLIRAIPRTCVRNMDTSREVIGISVDSAWRVHNSMTGRMMTGSASWTCTARELGAG
jgi:hypothetical protein